jgi:DNA processing protein
MKTRPADGAAPGTAYAPRACSGCLTRSWLLARISGHLDRARDRVQALLELPDDELIAALAGAHAAAVTGDRGDFDAGAARARCAGMGVESICRCDPGYPARLRDLPAAPAVVFAAGGLDRFLELAAGDGVAIVGARRASPYSVDVARSLARGAQSAGVTVVSGMALGIDSAAHEGALDAGPGTIAVLPAAPDRPYPASGRRLHRRILGEGGVVISELGPGVPVRRWMFPARNRLIAALSAMTVVVAARRGSGAMLTARLAGQLGREIGAVAGQVTAPLSWGPHELLRSGARLVTGPTDILDALFGAGRTQRPGGRPSLGPQLQPLLDALADGHDTRAALQAAGLAVDAGLAALASLELAGRVRREAGGRFSVLP